MELVRTIKVNQATPQYMLADLVDEYGDSLYKFCLSLTYSREDADDLFQETFSKIFEQLPKLNDSDNPKGFIFSTAVFIWKSWKRKYARRNRLAPAEPLDENVPSSVSTEASFMEQEEIRIVQELVEALPDKFKIPTILYYTVEMSVPDIAVTLKLPAGTVKSRLFKARKLVERGLVAIHYDYKK
ncbi:RNA polymerase sigma factor, sigma-70 family [Desulfitobacterium dehalogenans ATCC 51507]|uniref:RNA polymerase sigma factor, sigma-70 family n=1 Tax=Desulfitobacterium dehalogenans (strain ATCC 51507 / DSM 9161 / JW/IU-DC1) TaxID=756499 RepID=I4A3I1_DESDJ|nr:RNA polymerase sigma factor, sigma-70 family [Desulfitobacterium dehalogenans ATCC 51507]